MKTLTLEKPIRLTPSLKSAKISGDQLGNLLKKSRHFNWSTTRPKNFENDIANKEVYTQLQANTKTIENVKLEVAEVYSSENNQMQTALLLTICEDQEKKNCFLISIQQLLSEISTLYKGSGIKNQTEDTISFENLFHCLSLREQQVLTEVSHGKTSNEIARKFFISTNTVKNHRKNIKKKLNFSNHVVYSRFLKWTVDYCEKVPNT